MIDGNNKSIFDQWNDQTISSFMNQMTILQMRQYTEFINLNPDLINNNSDCALYLICTIIVFKNYEQDITDNSLYLQSMIDLQRQFVQKLNNILGTFQKGMLVINEIIMLFQVLPSSNVMQQMFINFRDEAFLFQSKLKQKRRD